MNGIGSGNTIAATVTEGKNNGEGTTAVGIYLDSTIQTSIAGENTISARNEGTTPGNKAVGMYITQNAHVDGGIRDAVISAWSAGDAAIGIAMDYSPDTGNISNRIHDLTNVTISATSEKGRAIGVGVSFTDPTLTQSGYGGEITGSISVAARGDVFGFVYGRNVSDDLSVGGIALYSENTGDSYHFPVGLSKDLTLKATSLGHSAGADSSLNSPSGNRAYGFYVGNPDGGLTVSYIGEIKLQLEAEAQGAAYGVFADQDAYIGGVNQVAHVKVNSISDSAYGIYAASNSTIGIGYGLQGAVTVRTTGAGKAYGVYLEDKATAGNVSGSIDLESARGTSVGVYMGAGAKAGTMSGDMTIRAHGDAASYGVFLRRRVQSGNFVDRLLQCRNRRLLRLSLRPGATNRGDEQGRGLRRLHRRRKQSRRLDHESFFSRKRDLQRLRPLCRRNGRTSRDRRFARSGAFGSQGPNRFGLRHLRDGQFGA